MSARLDQLRRDLEEAQALEQECYSDYREAKGARETIEAQMYDREIEEARTAEIDELHNIQ